MSLPNCTDGLQISTAEIPIPIWVASATCHAVYANAAWLQFTGQGQISNSMYGWLGNIHPDDRAAAIDEYSAAQKHQRNCTSCYRLKHASGSYRWIREIGVVLTNEAHQFDGFLGYCIDIDEQKQAETARREMAERLVNAQEAERARIGRELHDDISQALVVLGIQLLRAGKPVSGEPEQTHPGPTELYAKLKEIAQRVTALSHELHSSSLEYLGLKLAVQGCCREFSRQYRISVDCSCSEIPARLNPVVALGLFRVLQEALHNIAKHSGAKKVAVELAQTPSSRLELIISDDGVGFEIEQAYLTGGIGLLSMRERINLIDGTFHVESSLGKGSKIVCIVPLDKPFK